jgi:hypothetical protein
MVDFPTKNPNLGKFRRVLQCWFYGHLVYFTTIWYILWPFGTLFPLLVCCTKKNLATLLQTVKASASNRLDFPRLVNPTQGCQMVYFQTKNPILGKFGRVLLWNILLYFMAI